MKSLIFSTCVLGLVISSKFIENESLRDFLLISAIWWCLINIVSILFPKKPKRLKDLERSTDGH